MKVHKIIAQHNIGMLHTEISQKQAIFNAFFMRKIEKWQSQLAYHATL